MRPFAKRLAFVASLMALVAASDAFAVPKWAVGGFVDYNDPARGLKNRFSSVRKMSGALSFVHSDAFTVSLEYNRASFTHGKLETIPFIWSVDNKPYTSPNGSSTMKFNNFMINGVVYPGKENQTHGYKPKDYRWYLLIGGGYSSYKAVNQNFIYPGQNGGITKTLDPTKLMDPETDKRVAMAANLGVGVEAFISESWAIDVRARYNIVVGEVRPMLLWKLERVFPIQLFDLGVGMKFYFWR